MYFLATAIAIAPSVATAADLAALEQQAFNAAVESIADSVVQIRTVGGLAEVDDQTLAQGPTTGLIVTTTGYIVSSAFNFSGEPTSILVRLPDGRQRPAELVGRDANRMLVLLKVDVDEDLPTCEAAELADVRPGDWAVAVGRTYQEDRVSMSVGVVSALNRMHGRAIQTDANVSVANYGGPLVDVHGRVLGILVPMAPPGPGAAETSPMAGAEYYDSGIGFAIPLEHIHTVLERWINDKELKRGVLGVGLNTGSAHSTAPIVTAVWPKSPASVAGWKPKDRIVAIEGEKVDTQTQLRFQVVPHYAGDKLAVTIRRGSGDDAEELETTVTLADKLPPYQHAFLGILPERTATVSSDEEADDDEETPPAARGLAVRAVWPDSPAAAAGVEPGDIITKLGDEEVATIQDALAQLNARNVDDELKLSITREGEKLTLDAKLATLPTEILASSDLPKPPAEERQEEDAAPPELKELKLPEMEQVARYLQPPTAEERAGGFIPPGPPGLIIWLGDGKPESAEALPSQWQRACRRDNLVLLMPSPADPSGWTSDDLEYLAALLRTVPRRFAVDPRRVIIVGQGKAGQLAYTVAFKARNLIRGMVAIESPLPRALELPENAPNDRLAILSIETQNTPLSLLIRNDVSKIEAAGYPTTRIIRSADKPESTSDLDASVRGKIARWIDALDRF